MLNLKSVTCAAVVALAAALPQGAAAQSEDRPSLVIGSLGGNLDATFRKVFKPFEDSKKISIRWVPSVPAETIAKVAATRNAPDFDVVITDFVAQQAGTNLGLFAPVDPAIVTNYKDVPDRLRLIGNNGVGFGIYYTGIFYRHAEFEKRGWAAPTSWGDLLRPEFCNQVGLLHPNVLFGVHTVVMLSDGKLGNMAQGIDRLSKIKNCVSVLEPSAPKLEEKVLLGEYLIGVHASIRAIPLIQRGVPITFILPKEGSMLTITAASPVKNARNPQLAQEFLNWFIAPEGQRIVMQEASFGPTNRTVSVPPDLLKLGVPDETIVAKLLPTDVDAVAKTRRDMIRQLERAMAR